ncbi:hypothetical protein GALMADRAFT_215174 [Galerina marginata CBS 339.88]|uniref:Uncharacterized protein n=1 Tax=Galerina marginata (strain CBS 339.88) TaxID=685588 RepID=A0A067SRY2_GALM3|nr:hypothetical protein GALMADRAFT_215174 [Galerina marginata CBS 339.88]
MTGRIFTSSHTLQFLLCLRFVVINAFVFAMTDTKSEVLRLQTHRPDVRDIELYIFQGCDPLFPLLSPPAGSSEYPSSQDETKFAYLAACTPFLQGKKSKSPSRHELGSNKSRRARHSHSVRRVDCLQTLLFFIQTEPLVKLALGVFDSNSHLSSLGPLVRVFPKNESIGDGTVMRDRRIISDSDHPCYRKLDLTNVLVNTHEVQSGRLPCPALGSRSLLNSRRFIMACWFGPRMVSPPYDDRCFPSAARCMKTITFTDDLVPSDGAF